MVFCYLTYIKYKLFSPTTCAHEDVPKLHIRTYWPKVWQHPSADH